MSRMMRPRYEEQPLPDTTRLSDATLSAMNVDALRSVVCQSIRDLTADALFRPKDQLIEGLVPVLQSILKVFSQRHEIESWEGGTRSKLFPLHGLNLTRFKLDGLDLSHVSFADTRLNGASFRNCHMHDVVLDRASCIGTNFTGVSLSPRSCHNALFQYACWNCAILYHTDMRDTRALKVEHTTMLVECTLLPEQSPAVSTFQGTGGFPSLAQIKIAAMETDQVPVFQIKEAMRHTATAPQKRDQDIPWTQAVELYVQQYPAHISLLKVLQLWWKGQKYVQHARTYAH